MKKAKIILILVLIGVWVYVTYFKKEKPTNEETVPGTGSTPAKKYTRTTVLKKGDKGEMVKELQWMLNTHFLVGFAPLVKDGVFGSKTEQALVTVTGQKQMSVENLKAQLNL